jgi:hypothetical protein
MAEYLVNPRRSPRAPARCKVTVKAEAFAFAAETEDIGPHGCQVVAPRALARGAALDLRFTNPGMRDGLRVAGRVAWASSHAPWRVGVAFAEASIPDSTRWFTTLLESVPGMGAYKRLPERISVDAMIYLGPPPRFVVDFTADEVRILRAIGSGVSVDELRLRLRDRFDGAKHALFSLLMRSHVTLARGGSAHPESWKRILDEEEASLAAEALDGESAATPPPLPPLERPAAPPPPVAAVPPRPSTSPVPPPPPPVAAPPPARTPPPAAPAAAGTPPPMEIYRDLPTPDFQGAGVGWRTPRERSAAAHELFVRAVQERDAGSVQGAIALLRRALALAPGDPEIARALGDLAFKPR